MFFKTSVCVNHRFYHHPPVSVPAGRVLLPAETSGGETGRDRPGPGRTEEEYHLHLHLSLHPPLPQRFLPSLLLSGATTPPGRRPPAADPLTTAKCTRCLSQSTGTMNPTHLRFIPESGTPQKLNWTRRETEAGPVEVDGATEEEEAPLWSLRRFQMANQAQRRRIRGQSLQRRLQQGSRAGISHRDDSIRNKEAAGTELPPDWLPPPLTPPSSLQQPIGKSLHRLSAPLNVNRTLWPAGLARGRQTSAVSKPQWRSQQRGETAPHPAAEGARAGRGAVMGEVRQQRAGEWSPSWTRKWPGSIWSDRPGVRVQRRTYAPR